MKFEDTVLVVAGTLTGLFAGLLYAFSVAIIPALRRLKGTEHIAEAHFGFNCWLQHYSISSVH